MMKKKIKLKSLLKIFGSYLIIWMLALILFSFIRLMGTIEVVNGQIIARPFTNSLFLMVPLAFLLSLLSVIADQVLNVKRTMYMSYGKVSLLSFAMNIIMLVVMVFLAMLLMVRFGIYELAPDKDIFRTVFSRNMLVAGIYISVVNFIISISRQVNANMGKGNLWKLITGKYHLPKEEEYIFMFLDLKSSTTAAELMGHMKYSQMIQECYNDLTIPLQNTEASVYQYVGDEAVIMWPPSLGLDDLNCLRMYFEFDNILKQKKKHFESKYNWFPQFKAGLHVGPVIATQVGAIKREIAFHGDTLNTTARILSLCNEKGEKLLISETLKDLVVNSNQKENPFDFLEQGNELLKGRSTAMKIYSVSSASSS